jgi:MFS family permease
MLTGLALIAPLAVLTPLMPSSSAMLIGVALLYFSIALTSAVATIAFVEVSPPRLRGQVVALYLLIGNLFGLMVGPVSVGWLLDSSFSAVASVGRALALVCLATALPALWLLWRARRAFAGVVVAD